MIKIYGTPHTRTSRVLWSLEEAGADYDFIHIQLGKGEGRQEPYLKLNPTGKVPTLVHDDLVLTESAAICTYVGDLFPNSHLTPASGTADRAIYNQWCFFAMTELEQPLWSMVKHKFALPKEYRLREMLTTASYEFDKVIDVFSLRLGDRKFLVGDSFSNADIIVASILDWARNGNKRSIPLRHENIEKYLDRILAREAFSRVLEREEKI